MKHIKSRVLGLITALALTVGLTGSALAYTTPDFTDLPQDHWAYETVMELTDAGVILGTGEGRFSPNTPLSVTMFMTLVSRVLGEELDLSTLAEENWYRNYIYDTQSRWAGYGISNQPTIESPFDMEHMDRAISRYEMAVILLHAVREVIGAQPPAVDVTQISDFPTVPWKYLDVVAQVYAFGLIQGDETGAFHGEASMTRAEAAVVVSRLMVLKDEVEAGPPMDPPGEMGPMREYHIRGTAYYINDGETLDQKKPAAGAHVFVGWDGSPYYPGLHTVTDKNGTFDLIATYPDSSLSYTGKRFIDVIYTAPDGKRYSNLVESYVHSNDLQSLLTMSAGMDLLLTDHNWTDFERYREVLHIPDSLVD